MYTNPFIGQLVVRERQREMMEQARRNRLAGQLRSAARATRLARRAVPRRPAVWLTALSPSAWLR